MTSYHLTWITDKLATGYAPMSYAELDAIKAQGINAMVNLCGEFCDLHEIEIQHGFDVYYLPIPDECAPDMKDMEEALAWLDEALYLGKKVLIHCRHGVGRTGTFLTSYLLRRGLNLKKASKTIKKKAGRAQPTNYCQWKLLRKYDKQTGKLTRREPTLELRNPVDLGIYFTEYEALVNSVETTIAQSQPQGAEMKRCGRDLIDGCYRYFDLQLIEAVYISSKMNRTLKSEVREAVIHDASVLRKKIRSLPQKPDVSGTDDTAERTRLMQAYSEAELLCPLNRDSKCLLYEFRPIGCRLFNVAPHHYDSRKVNTTLLNISRSIFLALSGLFMGNAPIRFSMASTVSGKFIEEYFVFLAQTTRPDPHRPLS